MEKCNERYGDINNLFIKNNEKHNFFKQFNK